MQVYNQKGRILPAILLILGSGIGTGYIGLAMMRSAGFINDLLLTIIIFFFTLASGLLWAEATIAAGDEAHIPTIGKKYLGRFGVALSSLSFLWITTHYLIDNFGISSSIINSFFLEKLNISISPLLISISLFLFFGTFLFLGTRASSRLNFVFVTGFIFSFATLFFLKFDTYTLNRLLEGQWIYIIFITPILTYAFNYQFIIPTCCHFLNNDVKKIKLTIYLSVFLIFIFLLFWQIFIIQIIPDEALVTNILNRPIFAGMRILSNSNMRNWFFLIFIFTTFTSIVTCTLSLLDFFLDFFHIPRNKTQLSIRSIVIIFILLPTALFTTFFLHQFLPLSRKFISWVEIIFIGIMPAWIVVNIRYQKKLNTPRLLPGGSATLIFYFFFILILTYIQGANLIWSP